MKCKIKNERRSSLKTRDPGANRRMLFPFLSFFLLVTMGACSPADVPLIAIQVSPLCVGNVGFGEQVQFNATVFIDEVEQAPNPDNSAVTWTVLGGGLNGTVSNDVGSEGLYTAPDATPPDVEYVTVIATSNEDTQKQDQASVFINEPCPPVPPFSQE